MSRIYDALKRAAEKAKDREVVPAPPFPEDGGQPQGASPPLVATLSTPSQGRQPPEIRPALQLLREDPITESLNQVVVEPPATIKDLQADRQEVRRRLQVILTAERERMASEGRYPYEGKWLTVEEIRRLRRSMQRKDLGIVVQLFFLFCFMGFTGLVFFQALTQFFVPR